MTKQSEYFDKLNANSAEIYIPEWDQTIYVGPLTFSQYQKIEAAEKKGNAERGLMIIEACAKNKDGSLPFQPDELRDMRLKTPAWLITRISIQIMDAQKRYREEEEGARDTEGN